MSDCESPLKGKWALILGASSGFGAATARKLASKGMNIFGVHLDFKQNLPKVRALVEEIESHGVKAVYFNMNATNERKRARAIQKMKEELAASGESHIWLMMHSLAFGTLKLFITEDPKEAIDPASMNMTLEVMAHSLVYWTQALWWEGMLGRGSRIFSMTSEGSHRAMPYYGAVSAAKAALEAHTRQLALELGKHGVLVNCIQAGVTDTPALRQIPGHEQIIEHTKRRNPGGRLTTPEDVANTIAALASPEVMWVSGSVIFVDGGEDITA
ncbi:MAG TPA: SDR family oxidoreductase [Anaerolineae bacterium]|nr:SDR family oxidoreductase [Anaerolineae bacterium]